MYSKLLAITLLLFTTIVIISSCDNGTEPQTPTTVSVITTMGVTDVTLSSAVTGGNITSDSQYFFFTTQLPGGLRFNHYRVDAQVIYDLITEVKKRNSAPENFSLSQNYSIRLTQ